ncbi:MAG TPA: hypothetical protein PLD20_11340 [Blastocatellia bacterium]|nr:hypothetical protein [Blastocatellia bacterium]HMZ18516.1 hypothetical protein [Blastocatellia bacterium]HNG31104.1 hypothetical protein [Blastocatellia bacterium]
MIFLTTTILLLIGGLTAAHRPATQKEQTMNVLKLQTTIGEGKDKQVEQLFEGPRRKLTQITLRNGATLDAHTAPEPITIQCLAGKGTVRVGDPSETVELTPGVLLTVEPNVLHEIKSHPAVTFLLTRFKDK